MVMTDQLKYLAIKSIFGIAVESRTFKGLFESAILISVILKSNNFKNSVYKIATF
jgi:hypothetical protein